MEQRDFLKDQIEQMGKVLAKVLADFFHLKNEGNVSEGVEIANQHLREKIDIDIEKLTGLNKAELKDYCMNRNLTADHLESLAEYLKEVGLAESSSDNKMAKAYWLKSIELLEIANEISGAISFKGLNRKSEIEGLLRDSEKS